MNRPLPDFQQKQRHLHAEKLPPAALIQLAEQWMQVGNLNDAIDYFGAAKSSDHLKNILRQSIQEGDLFFAEKCASALGLPMDKQQYNELGEQARRLGKLLFAQRAFEKAGNPMAATPSIQTPANVTL